MYLPIFIAILLGLMAPSNNTSTNKRGCVYVNTNEPKDQYSMSSDSTSYDGGTGGDTGHVPPPRPKP